MKRKDLSLLRETLFPRPFPHGNIFVKGIQFGTRGPSCRHVSTHLAHAKTIFLPRGRPFRNCNSGRNEEDFLEARVRIELTHKGFADLSLTTWVPRHPTEIIAKLTWAVSRAEAAFSHFLAAVAIFASRRNRAASSGGVGLI